MAPIRFLCAALLACSLALPGASQAQERGTRDEAKAMVDAAVEHARKVGADKALKDFSSDKATWAKKDLYVFAFDLHGVNVAHGVNEKIIGKNMFEVKDSGGKAYVQEFIRVAATAAGGWVDYEFSHPQTRKIEPKASYVRKLPGADALVGVGIYR